MARQVLLAAGLALATPAMADWRLAPAPVWEGQYAAVGDPSVLRDGEDWLMFHHCLDVLRDPQGSEVCLATSADGHSWRHARSAESVWLVRGRLLRADPEGWDQAHETPFAHRAADGTIRLYLLGYRGASLFDDPPSHAIGLTVSTDPRRFPGPVEAILRPGEGADAGGMTSPSVVELPGGPVMFYTGWSCSVAEPGCWERLRLSLMVVALDAEGRPDGAPRLSLGDPGPAWANGGTSESTVVAGPEGWLYLIFSSLPGPRDSPYFAQRIGIARARTPEGPWEVWPEPLLTPEAVAAIWGPGLTEGGVLAPDVLRDPDGTWRMWFHAFALDEQGGITAGRIGLAETSGPLWPGEASP